MKFTITRVSEGRAFLSPLKLGSGKNSPPEGGKCRSSSGPGARAVYRLFCLLAVIAGTSLAGYSQSCPPGMTSFNIPGYAVGWKATNGGGDPIDPEMTTGPLQLSHGQFGLFRPDNASLLDAAGDTLILNMGELVTPGSVVTMSLGYFSNTASRMRIEYSTDLTTWTTVGFYSRNTSSDLFYSTFGSRVAHHFNFPVATGGLRYLRFTRLSGSCYVEGVRYESFCRSTTCLTGVTPATSVVTSGTTNVTNPEKALGFEYPEGQQLYTTTTISADAAVLQANGNSQLTVDLGTLVDAEKQLIISYTGWKANDRRLTVSTSTDGVNYRFLTSIGKGTNDALYAMQQYLDGTYNDAETYTYFSIPMPPGGARYVRVVENGTGGGVQAYIDGIGYGCGVFDFGDANDTAAGSGTGNFLTGIADNGPRHVVRFPYWYTGSGVGSSLYLNEKPNRSLNAATSPRANKDDFEGFTPPSMPLCGAYTIPKGSISMTNTTGGSVTLHAWVDFDGDGLFSNDEYASATHNGTSLSGDLIWPEAENRTAANLIMRMRVTSTSLQDNPATPEVDERSIGLAGDGEVEDHFISQESFTVKGVNVGDCRNDNETGNTAKVIVAVLMDWNRPTAGARIEVTVGDQSKVLDPTVPGLPEYAQFIFNADGTTKPVTVRYVTPGCTKTINLSASLPAPCTPPVCGGPGTIGGRAFTDLNGNGVAEGEEEGLENLTVKLYDDLGRVVCQTLTGFQGYWVCTGLPDSLPVRIEFIGTPGMFGSSGGGSSIQFGIVGTGCNNNLALYTPGNYTSLDPWMATTCFGKGDPLLPGSSASADPTIVANRFLTPQGLGNANFYLAKGSETGTLWGLSMSTKTNSIFSTAFLRRHSGLGPGGLGAIYRTDVTGFLGQTSPPTTNFGNTSLFINLDNYGINTGDETAMTRNLGVSGKTPTHDPDAFGKVGKWGLGDIDINPGNDTMWVVNLYNRSLVQIVMNGLTISQVTEIPIPDPGCSDNSDWRPFALKYSGGKLYVGGVCSGESTQDPQDMYAYVMSMDGSQHWKEELSFSLAFQRGITTSNGDSRYWLPWTDDFFKLKGTGYWRWGPTPMVSDIEFDAKGNMIIGVADRSGYQTASGDYSTNTSKTIL